MPGASPQGTNAATLLQLGLLDKLLMLALKGNEPSNGPIRTEVSCVNNRNLLTVSDILHSFCPRLIQLHL